MRNRQSGSVSSLPRNALIRASLRRSDYSAAFGKGMAGSAPGTSGPRRLLDTLAAPENPREPAAPLRRVLVAGEGHQHRRRHDQRQHRREGQAEDDRRGQRNPPLGRRGVDRRLLVEDFQPEAEGDRQHAEDERRPPSERPGGRARGRSAVPHRACSSMVEDVDSEAHGSPGPPTRGLCALGWECPVTRAASCRASAGAAFPRHATCRSARAESGRIRRRRAPHRRESSRPATARSAPAWRIRGPMSAAVRPSRRSA